MKQIAQLEKSYFRSDLPNFSSGDTVRVHYRIKEGDKERIQVFQGTVIGRRGSGTGASFTVRKISSGIGVERVFPLHSPNIAQIEKIRIGKVRRNKLYYLRELTGKSARIKEQLIDKNAKTAKKKKPVAEAVAEAAVEKPVEEKVETKTETTAEAKGEEKVKKKTKKKTEKKTKEKTDDKE